MEDGTEKVEIPEEYPNAVGAATEENVPDLMPDMEHAHVPHGRGSGIHWLDMIIGLSAMFVSVVSLWVSIGHGKTMEKMVDQNQKMVEASTLPLLTADSTLTNNPLHPEKSQLKIELKNSGIGPAMIDWFEVSYKGKSYNSDPSMQGVVGLLKDCCGAALPKGSTVLPSTASPVTGEVLPAREIILVFGIAPQTPELLAVLKDANDNLKMKACYCSVLNECWETEFDRKRPRPVNKCQVPPNEKLW